MNGDKNVKFGKSVKNAKNKNPHQKFNNAKKQKAKEILINKYNLSESEAEKKLIQIENRAMQKKIKNKPNQQVSTYELNEKNASSKDITQHIKIVSSTDSKKPTKEKTTISKNYSSKESTEKNQNITSEKVTNFNEIYNNTLKNDSKNIKNKFKRKNSNKRDTQIEEILQSVVSNYSQEVSIELNHVNLTFDVQEDRIDNLKEQIIRTIKRTKSETIKFHVLNDISFKIYQGEKVGIIGYNGAGKSTLLKLISGIYKPDEGTLKTNGNISPLLGLGAGFDYNFSGAKNIFLNAAVLGYEKEFIEQKYDEIVEFADLGKFINIPIRNYSSGMMAKLGFAIATTVNPDILIIDEILGVGDVNFQRKSRDKMKSLMGGKTTVLLVSHSINQIRELCDKAIWIDKGKVREIGEVNEVCDHYLKDSVKATKEQLKDIQFN